MEETGGQHLERHRYRSNEISSERLDQFRGALNDIKKDNSEVIGATVFGSNVLGEAKETSDIDAYVFVNCDEKDDENVRGTNPDQDDPTYQYFAANVEQPLRERAAEITGQEDSKDIQLVMLSKKRMDKELGDLIDFQKKTTELNTKWDQYIEGETTNKPTEEYPDSPRENLNALFNMQIGGRDLDQYRAYVLDTLSESGNIGDDVFKSMIDNARHFEHRFLSEEEQEAMNLPKTVDEARKYYKLDYTLPKYPVEKTE